MVLNPLFISNHFYLLSTRTHFLHSIDCDERWHKIVHSSFAAFNFLWNFDSLVENNGRIATKCPTKNVRNESTAWKYMYYTKAMSKKKCVLLKLRVNFQLIRFGQLFNVHHCRVFRSVQPDRHASKNVKFNVIFDCARIIFPIRIIFMMDICIRH